MGGGQRVLVVDDDEGVRTAVTWALEADGFEVVAVDNGLAAMEAIETATPSLSVLRRSGGGSARKPFAPTGSGVEIDRESRQAWVDGTALELVSPARWRARAAPPSTRTPR